ncbi:molybdate ABC transporter substrate-binding protein [Maritimibacter sp. DP1N21-5]|uniref:molybdate ABC transporter substrate-binding protein n=1 Tax=Maritimibacter sp. DP1N21-5 TaxID=2836867 RepID=UPI001C484BD7|nr:molybdate ABC transporter substrate-binding protein [Maritimibacter sp. DP1N21-5]MBV7410927.1 molybdate ABC transporter substrate-binding protein [Maritimibacter sp. DP1N21-5]
MLRLALASVVFLLPLTARAGEVTVLAAASLKTALDEIALSFQAATGHDVVASYAGSSALARQIEQAIPGDVFISASLEWMNTLADQTLIDPDSRTDLLENEIVLVAHEALDPVTIDGNLDLAGMLGNGFLAMALVDAVPAGQYGKAALETLGLWSSLEDRVAQADNVRAALALVATGEAPFGIVYRTDASAEPAVTVVGTFPTDSHPRIVYPAAALASSDNPVTEEFLDFLEGPEARQVFEAQGFKVIAGE